ncbi:protein kinase domain-containing protein [Pseudovibrio denitrificans]|uniref:protein kinase domain-containing protein n=1 Tax=Pseudovibrio denitrificans TaxID=258256 RepID=UPI0006D1E1FD|nr:serine/threonine-protein kinase [Pseudovibrio denitrificans]
MQRTKKQLGPYRVLKQIGQGGMGVVFVGEHTASGKQVAIKMATKHEATKLNQLRQEIRSLAKIQHPGVVQILDHGVSDGLPWHAMEVIEAPTLTNVTKQIWSSQRTKRYVNNASNVFLPGQDSDTTITQVGEINLRESVEFKDYKFLTNRSSDAAAGRLKDVLTLTYGICEVLSYVHSSGIIHRDLKPDNIFILENMYPVLVDFGLVSEVRGTVGREVLEDAQATSGSPFFMAPEQILNETLDARCDLYSLGCILYELVTGLKPFSGSRVQVLHGHLERNPINPSDLVHGVPKALNDMIMSLLSKSTDQRIGYAETILQIIETLGVQRPHWPSTPSTGHSYLYRASFIENSKIQADIEDRLIQAKNGKGQVVIAFGESGLGKTRFASEIAKRVLKTGISVTTCECSFRGRHDTQPKPVTQPLYPFLHLLDHIADYCTEKGLEVYENILSEHAAILSEYSASIKSLTWVKHLPLAPKLEADQYLNRLFNALRSVLASYSQATPLLLILDDLQWADELSIAFLEFLTKEGLEGIAVLILGTMRTEEKTQQVSSMLKSNCVREVLLERMGIGDVEKLACGMLATEEIPQNFAEFLFEQSNGNPFFIAEYLRTAVAEHLLQRDRSGKWNFTHHTSSEAYCFKQLPLPNSLSELIKLRISRLTPEARKALDCAALLGRVFETELVSSVMQLHEENLGQIINELVERQVLEADEKDGFRFLHDKIREVTEHQLSSHQRRELHEKIARKLDNLRTNALKPETIDARLGHHWSCAGVPARAARHLRFAADFAHHQHANDEATRLNKAALSEIKKAEKTETGRQQYWNTELSQLTLL